MKKVLFFEREFDPIGKVPMPYSYQIQFEELKRYCAFHGLIFVKDFGEVNTEEYDKPLMEQNKIQAMLQWIDSNRGEVDTVLAYTPNHICHDKQQLSVLSNELIKRGIKIIFIHSNRTPKEISPQHTELMLKAFPEIAIIYKAIQEIGFTGRNKAKQWQDAALERFNQSPKEFSYIKREYLERDPLYKHLKAKQRARFFFGKIIQYIFRDENLPVLNKEEIIEEIRKTEGWKEFRGY